MLGIRSPTDSWLFNFDSMEVKIFELPPIGTNAYLLINLEAKEAVLFDAPMSAWKAVEPRLKNERCILQALYLTHGHWDHILDVARISELGVPVYAHRDDLELIAAPGAMAEFAMPGVEMLPGRVDHFLSDGEILKVWGKSMEIRHVPGHSAGSILFYFEELKFAITGDAIFAGSIGRTDFPGCSQSLLEQSIRDRIYSLPEETVLFPGHGPQTTVERERTTNPFVRA